MTKYLFDIIKFIWLLPATILIWLFYVLPLWVVGEIKYEGKADTFIWVFENPINPLSTYDRQWEKWAGWAGPCVFIYKKTKGYNGLVYDHTIRVHELKHVDDQFLLGVFFYPAYTGHSVWIYVSNWWSKVKRHPYLDNIFERRARKAAGQKVNYKRSEWPDGPNDFNPWL